MVHRRPDTYDEESAFADLLSRMEFLRSKSDLPLGIAMSGGFILLRIVEEEGMEEFQLSQVASSVVLYDPEGCVVYGWVPEVNLPGPLDPDDDL